MSSSFAISFSGQRSEVESVIQQREEVPDVVKECVSKLLGAVDADRVVSVATYGQTVSTEVPVDETADDGTEKLLSVSEVKLANVTIQIS